MQYQSALACWFVEITEVGGVADRLDSCDTVLRSQRAEGMMREDTHKAQYAKALHLGRDSSMHKHTLGTNQLESSLAQDTGTWQTPGRPRSSYVFLLKGWHTAIAASLLACSRSRIACRSRAAGQDDLQRCLPASAVLLLWEGAGEGRGKASTIEAQLQSKSKRLSSYQIFSLSLTTPVAKANCCCSY